MKSSRSERMKRLIFSPEAVLTKESIHAGRASISKLMDKYKGSPIPDPFRDIERAPNLKLKPILLKKKVPAVSARNSNPISLRLPEIADDGKLKHTRDMLPAINFRSAEKQKRLDFYQNIYPLQRVTSEKIINSKVHKNPNITLKSKISTNSTTLEVSFGNHNENIDFPTNLFNNY